MSGQDGNRNIPGRFPLKSTDRREISDIRIRIPRKSQTSIQVDNRAVLCPIFKRHGNRWVDAMGSVGLSYDVNLQYAILNNADDCDLDILLRIL